MPPKYAHVYCQRYKTGRYIVDYTGTFEVDIEACSVSDIGLVDMTLSERRSLILTCTEPENRIVVALHEIDPGELYVLKIPLADARAANVALSEIGAEKATFHYIEPMDQSITVTQVHPNANWLVENGAAPTTSEIISVSFLSVLVSMVAVKDAVIADPSILSSTSS